MCDDDKRVPTNQSIVEEIAALRSEIREHRFYVDKHFVTRDSLRLAMSEMSDDIARKVPGMLDPLIRDAMTSAVSEERHNAQTQGQQQFKDWYAEVRKEEREERRQDILNALGKPRLIASYLTPLFQFVLAAAAVWFLIQGVWG